MSKIKIHKQSPELIIMYTESEVSLYSQDERNRIDLKYTIPMTKQVGLIIEEFYRDPTVSELRDIVRYARV